MSTIPSGNELGRELPKPFLEFLPAPREATLTAIDEMADSLSSVDTRVVTVSTDFIEAPSVDLAVKLLLAQLDGRRSFIKRFSRIPQPDPRHGESEFRLWKYGFFKFRRAVPRPSNRVLKTVASLADRPWDFEGNWHHAGEVAREMKLGQVPSVLAAMVYPPPIRNDSKACQWLQRVQIAAAQLATHIEVNAQIPASNSKVFQLIGGPLDWVVDAALIASVQRSNSEANVDTALGLTQRIRNLLSRIPTEGYWNCRETGIQMGLLIKDSDDAFQEFLQSQSERSS